MERTLFTSLLHFMSGNWLVINTEWTTDPRAGMRGQVVGNSTGSSANRFSNFKPSAWLFSG